MPTTAVCVQPPGIQKPQGRRRRAAPTGFAAVEAAVVEAFGVPLAALRASSRRAAPVAEARQAAMYLARTVLGLNYSVIGRACGRDRATVAHACRTIEDHRDDPLFDALIGSLEEMLHAQLRAAAASPGARP